MNAIRSAIDNRLAELFSQKSRQASQIDSLYSRLLEEMGAFIARGGKRIRPYLTYLSYKGLGGNDDDAILDVAISQELIHNFFLLHDDIIDRDRVRYGGPNLAGRFAQLYQKQTGEQSGHFGDSMALLAGDINAALATETILESRFDDDLKLSALKLIANTIFESGGGEQLDVTMPLLAASEVTTERLMKVCHFKTAVYSFNAPLQLGAIMVRADEQTLTNISKFAIPMGIAYQLADDLLGMFGEEAAIGKPVLSDLREGKRTVLISLGEEMSTPKQRQTIVSSLGRADVGPEELAAVQRVLQDCGARDKTLKLVEEHANQALSALESIGYSAKTRQELEQYAAVATQRRS